MGVIFLTPLSSLDHCLPLFGGIGFSSRRPHSEGSVNRERMKDEL